MHLRLHFIGRDHPFKPKATPKTSEEIAKRTPSRGRGGRAPFVASVAFVAFPASLATFRRLAGLGEARRAPLPYFPLPARARSRIARRISSGRAGHALAISVSSGGRDAKQNAKRAASPSGSPRFVSGRLWVRLPPLAPALRASLPGEISALPGIH